MAAVLPNVNECCADSCQEASTIAYDSTTAVPYIMLINPTTNKAVPVRVNGAEGAESIEFGTEEPL